MTNNRSPSPLWTYITECARLLYWTLFKPYTFKRWLQEEIHPELTRQDNPFKKRAEFPTNPHLRRYAGQVYWLTALMPLLIVLVIGLIFTLAGKEFDWFTRYVPPLGWFVGVTLASRGNLWLDLLVLLLSVVATIMRLGVVSDVALWVVLGVVLGVERGVGWGVASGVGFGVALGLL